MLVIGISGFMQPEKISNGMLDVVEKVADLGVPAKYFRGNDKVGQMVSLIAEHERERIILAGHSFGGVTCTWVAEVLLGKRRIYGMVLADAVSHIYSQPRVIKVSANVDNLWSWRQTKGRPRGSEIVTSASTRHQTHIVSCRHSQMDELPEFQDTIIKLAKGEL